MLEGERDFFFGSPLNVPQYPEELIFIGCLQNAMAFVRHCDGVSLWGPPKHPAR